MVSACAWLVAAFVSIQQSPQRGVIALFVGGVLIHPVSKVVTKLLGRSARHAPGNPMAKLAMQTTVWLIACLPLAYVVSEYRINWFFPAMLLVIAGRYMVFSSIFGSSTFWACGSALIATAYVLYATAAAPQTGALAGAALEALFSATLFARSRLPRASVATDLAP
jgi:hypothetical protein